jgi:transcriptional regulator with XRE-family HTH domain
MPHREVEPDKRFVTILNILILMRGERDREIAERLGIERALFSKIRNGRIKELAANTKRKLASYFGLKEDWVTSLIDRRALLSIAAHAFTEGTPMPSDPFETKAE